MRAFDFLDPTLLERSDFGRTGYRVYDVFATPQGRPVVVAVSEKAEPYHWHVQDGMSSYFFLSYADVRDFILRRNLVASKQFTHKQ